MSHYGLHAAATTEEEEEEEEENVATYWLTTAQCDAIIAADHGYQYLLMH
jgi:hypothetical protein